MDWINAEKDKYLTKVEEEKKQVNEYVSGLLKKIESGKVNAGTSCWSDFRKLEIRGILAPECP